MNYYGRSSRHTRGVSLGLCSSLWMATASSCFSTPFCDYIFLWEECPHFRHIFHSSSHVSRTSPMALVCVRVLIFALRTFHSHIFLPSRVLSFQSPVAVRRFESTMRTQSFLLAFLLTVTSLCKSLLSGLMCDRRADQRSCHQCP